MKRLVIGCGIISALIWLAVTFITRGIPSELCKNLSGLMPGVLQDEIMKMENGFYYDVANKRMPQGIFLFLFTLVFVIYFGLFLRLSSHPVNYTPLIIFFAVIFRFILLPSVMIHENDIYRYIWDGKVLLAGVNPYKYAPDDTVGRVDEIRKLKSIKKENPTFFNRIGHREVPTIYPPFSQLIFSVSNLIKKNSILMMKSIFVIFDILVIFVIYKMLVFFKMNPNTLIVYAWSPLVLKEFANSGHSDPIAIFFLLGALFFMFLKRRFLSVASLSLGIL